MLLWNKLGRKHRQWRALQGWERRVLLQFAVLLPLTWMGLRILGFKRMHRLCRTDLPQQAEPPASTNQIQLNFAQRYATLAAIASGHGAYQANCLHQSLPLCWLLRRQGLPAVLKIGVHSQTQTFLAHAWVELQGVPLGQSVTEYSVFNVPNIESKPSS